MLFKTLSAHVHGIDAYWSEWRWESVRRQWAISLVPADIRKERSALDMPMACGTGGVHGTAFRQAAQDKRITEAK
jgi:predicted ATPase with chaperone activity